MWDAKNDWSHTDLTKTSTKTEFIPVYSKGELILGKAPPCQGKPKTEVVRVIQ